MERTDFPQGIDHEDRLLSLYLSRGSCDDLMDLVDHFEDADVEAPAQRELHMLYKADLGTRFQQLLALLKTASAVSERYRKKGISSCRDLTTFSDTADSFCIH